MLFAKSSVDVMAVKLVVMIISSLASFNDKLHMHWQDCYAIRIFPR